MRAQRETSLDEILGDFNPTDTENKGEASERSCVTFWLTDEEKAIYDRMQALTKRKFGKKLKQIVKATIKIADKRAS